jgi:predicted TIM-barrel fold metal-dependent hydrolase
MFINHVHLMPRELREDATLESFLGAVEGLDFEGAVCFAPFSYQFARAGRTDNHNEWLSKTIESHSNLVGYGTLNTHLPAAPQVEHIAALGFRGIKLHPPAQKFEIFGAWARDAYAAMQSLGLTADFHIGVHWHRLRDYDPLLCDEIAFHYPRLRMVFEHVGGWRYYRQVLAVITNNANHGNHLYAGIASVLDRENQRYWWLGPEGVGECRWQIGPDMLIYGLDFPYNHAPQLRADLAQIHAFDWPKADIDALLGGNLKRLLGMTSGAARTVGGDANKAKQTPGL